jgi:hypothetical protein
MCCFKYFVLKEINYNKAALFLDTSYVVPTATGLPINLNAVGTAAVNLQMSGSLKAADFLKTHELDIEGKIRPRYTLVVLLFIRLYSTILIYGCFNRCEVSMHYLISMNSLLSVLLISV